MFYREAHTGATVYVITCSRQETSSLLADTEVTYYGKPFVLYEPRSLHSRVHGTQLVTTEYQLGPMMLDPEGLALSGIKESLVSNSNLETFLVEVPKLNLIRSRLVQGCKSNLCDSRHHEGDRCPTIPGQGGARPKLALKTTIHLGEADHSASLNGVQFQSFNLAKYFVGDDILYISRQNVLT